MKKAIVLVLCLAMLLMLAVGWHANNHHDRRANRHRCDHS